MQLINMIADILTLTYIYMYCNEAFSFILDFPLMVLVLLVKSKYATIRVW